MQRGATAVIFDVSENPEAIDQVSSWGQAQAAGPLKEAAPLLGLASPLCHLGLRGPCACLPSLVIRICTSSSKANVSRGVKSRGAGGWEALSQTLHPKTGGILSFICLGAPPSMMLVFGDFPKGISFFSSSLSLSPAS